MTPAASLLSPPEAVAPDRAHFLEVNRVRLRTWEWGRPGHPVVLCIHGAADHGRMWDGFAPLLAGLGFRVVAVDLRGHGDSSRLSTGEVWMSISLDIGMLAQALGPDPIGVVGHSFGGGECTFAASVWPERFAWVVNLDGLGPPAAELEAPDLAQASTDSVAAARRLIARGPRRYDSRDEMVERRAAMNGRLPLAWVHHLVEHGSRPFQGGWTWKLDPHFNLGLPTDFGAEHLRAENALVSRPLLVLTGAEPDTWSDMGAEEIEARLAVMPGARHANIEGAGHYVHIEQPDRVLTAVAEFIGSLPA